MLTCFPLTAAFNDNIDIALRWADAGNSVFPCDPGLETKRAKRPLTERGFHDASNDHHKIREWWKRWPHALIGLPTSDFWILDLDSENRSITSTLEGLSRVLRISASEIIEQSGSTTLTPSGGMHAAWARISGVAIRNDASDIAVNVDTRGHDADGNARGYVIAPGTRTMDDRCYEPQRSGTLTVAPLCLLYPAVFSARERETIRKSGDLMFEIERANPVEWRAIFDRYSLQSCPRRAWTPSTDALAGPLRLQAIGDLAFQSEKLASLTHGRRKGIWIATCAVGKYVAAGALRSDEVRLALLEAWEACRGALERGGIKYGIEQIEKGLAQSANDRPPPIARQYFSSEERRDK